MLTKCLQHHQGCPETPKSADVICERPLRSSLSHDYFWLCAGDQEKQEPGDPGAGADEKEAMRSVPVVYPPLATKV